MKKKAPTVNLIYIKAHTNNKDEHSLGNYNADKLANMAIGLDDCPYIEINKIYLNVPFKEKDEAKNMGCKWDIEKRKWYILSNNKNKTELLSKYK